MSRRLKISLTTSDLIRRLKQKAWLISAPDLYPELGFERTLARVLLEIIQFGGGEIDLLIVEADHTISSASFSREHRKVYVSVGAVKRIFILDCWSKGIMLASLCAPEMKEAARAVKQWLIDRRDLDDMKSGMSSLEASEMVFEIERGNSVTACWEALLYHSPWLQPGFVNLVRAAAERPLLRQLRPVASLGQALSFSRTIGYPFRAVCH